MPVIMVRPMAMMLISDSFPFWIYGSGRVGGR